MSNDLQSIGIFYIEDNAVSRRTLKNELRGITDFHIIGEATTGAEAVEKIKGLEPDVVLADIGLPDMDGIEVVKRIKALRPGARVLMLTASDEATDIFDAIDAGADGYILKGEAARQKEHARSLEVAIRSVKVGAVWLDPAIARLVLRTTDRPESPRRKVEPIALSTEEKALLGQVAESNCEDGVCLVEPEFLNNLRRFRASNNKNGQCESHASGSTTGNSPIADATIHSCERS